MSSAAGTLLRDADNVPVQLGGLLITTTKTFASTGTQNIPIFTVIGTVEVLALYGIVTTDIGVNHTASAFRINDQTAQVYLTAVGGTTISAKKAGSMIVKTGLVATAVTLVDNAAGAILEPSAAQGMVNSEIFITKKTGALTQIEYHFATTDNPTTGAIQFFCCFLPVSIDGDVQSV